MRNKICEFFPLLMQVRFCYVPEEITTPLPVFEISDPIKPWGAMEDSVTDL